MKVRLREGALGSSPVDRVCELEGFFGSEFNSEQMSLHTNRGRY